MKTQGRIGELGREMAKFSTSPGMLSTMPSRVQRSHVHRPSNTSFVIHAQMSFSITVHSISNPTDFF